MIKEIKKWGISKKWHDESGVVFILLIVCILVILGFAALAIDVGHVMVVRNELQNAADATALTAASHLFPHTPVSTPAFPPPNWGAADTEADNAIPLNNSDGVALTSCQTECGYWDINTHAPSGYWGLCTAMPSPPQPIPTNLAPGIRVVVSRAGSSGANGGPVQHFFARVFGMNTSDVSARATAVLCTPGQVRSNGIIPVTVSRTVYDLVGMGVDFDISNLHIFSNGSIAGQWTSFFDPGPPSTTEVAELIAGGNPDALSIGGSSMYLLSGVHNSLYATQPHGNIDDYYAGQVVYLPVVNEVILPSNPTQVPLAGFVSFHITEAVGGNQKRITGHFDSVIYDGTGPIGPGWGPLDLARLVQ